MKAGFKPISLAEYVEIHLQSNPGDRREEITALLKSALKDFKSGIMCRCGNPVWVIGSAFAGIACFTCITGESDPSGDFEIDEACGRM